MSSSTIVTGLMGGGKSYYGVELILNCLKEGGVAHTNIPLNWEDLHARYPNQLIKLPRDPARWVRQVPIPPGLSEEEMETAVLVESDILIGGEEGAENLVVIDESALDFDADDQGTAGEKKRVKPIFQLIALQRHVGIEIVFLAQDAKHINAKLRAMMQTRVECRNARKMPLFGWFAAPLFGDFLRMYYNKQESLSYGRSWVRFDPEVGNAYQTHGMREKVGLVRKATRVKGSGDLSKKGRNGMLVGVGLALAVGVFAAWKFFDMWNAPKPGHVALVESETPVSEEVDSAEIRVDVDPVAVASRPMIEVEWAIEDEFYVVAKWQKNHRLVVSLGTGERLFVGGSFRGELVLEVVPFRGWEYWLLETGRYVVTRPINYQERLSLRQPLTNDERTASVADPFMGLKSAVDNL